jgi:hypothetical protein
MAKNLRLKIEELGIEISELKVRNQELISSSEIEKNSHNEALANLKSAFEVEKNIKIEEKQTEVDELETNIESLEDELEQAKLKLDQKEVKKLAKAYEEQEISYNNASKLWLKVLTVLGVILFISAIISIALPSNEPWYKEVKYYFIDIVLISAVWFSGSQYSDYIKLRNDYANRKTIAQSFHNILNNLVEDEAIKNKFIEKATDVLSAPSVATNKEPVLSKKVFKDVVEIIKASTSK